MSDDRCKVCTTLKTWGRPWMEQSLVARWRGEEGEEGERMGYRRLAYWLNVSLLQRAMDRAGLPTAGNEAASRYDRLIGDDETVARGVREVLREGGVPIDDLERDFVSYGVVRTHLRDCLDLDRPTVQTGGDWEADAVEGARRRAEDRVFAAVRARYNKGRLEAGGLPEVDVAVTITCPVCGTTVPVDEAFEAGRLCDCPAQSA
jgi:hypothetical protein